MAKSDVLPSGRNPFPDLFSARHELVVTALEFWSSGHDGPERVRFDLACENYVNAMIRRLALPEVQARFQR